MTVPGENHGSQDAFAEAHFILLVVRLSRGVMGPLKSRALAGLACLLAKSARVVLNDITVYRVAASGWSGMASLHRQYTRVRLLLIRLRYIRIPFPPNVFKFCPSIALGHLAHGKSEIIISHHRHRHLVISISFAVFLAVSTIAERLLVFCKILRSTYENTSSNFE